jgi:catechol 2,3-dioxygenase-like lactoylglutathione lyase family enzyme
LHGISKICNRFYSTIFICHLNAKKACSGIKEWVARNARLNAFEARNMKIGSIVIRCYEFDRMLAFWQEALHYVPREPAKGGWVVLRDPAGRGPNLSLDQVANRRVGKRSRLHLDLYTNDQENEVERLIKIGATRYPWKYRPGDDFIVLADPDDNLFCVVKVTGETSARN